MFWCARNMADFVPLEFKWQRAILAAKAMTYIQKCIYNPENNNWEIVVFQLFSEIRKQHHSGSVLQRVGCRSPTLAGV